MYIHTHTPSFRASSFNNRTATNLWRTFTPSSCLPRLSSCIPCTAFERPTIQGALEDISVRCLLDADPNLAWEHSPIDDTDHEHGAAVTHRIG